MGRATLDHPKGTIEKYYLGEMRGHSEDYKQHLPAHRYQGLQVLYVPAGGRGGQEVHNRMPIFPQMARPPRNPV
jgi:hypothetical protein